MAGERRPGRAVSAPNHLPPLELLPFVTETTRGTYKVTERFETPLDEHGVPDAVATLQRLGEAMIYDPAYVEEINLKVSNVHHHAYARRHYAQHGYRSAQLNYREGATIKTQMFIPFHNLEHIHGIEPPIPRLVVMRERAREQRMSHRLYKMASAALWLDEMGGNGQPRYRTAEGYVASQDLSPGDHDMRFVPSHASFLDFIDTLHPGRMGILPDLDELATVSLAAAVKRLEAVARYETALSSQESTAIILEASRRATYGEAA